MSCYFHPKVPTLVACRDCGKDICSSCSQEEICPSCRLTRALRATAMTRRTMVSDRSNGNPSNGAGAGATAAASPVVGVAPPSDDRVLAAVCYLLWPIALLMLVLPAHRSKFVRFHVVQAIGVNLLGVALYAAYALAAHLPVIGWQSALMVPFLVPVWFLVDMWLAVRAYGGHTTHVPVAADFAERYAG